MPERFRQIAGLVHTERAIEARLNRPAVALPLLPQLLDTEFEHVHSSMYRPLETPENFYRGLCRNFTPILNEWDVRRTLGHKLLRVLEANHEAARCQFYTVLGPAGSGKSTLLRRLAVDLAAQGRLCLHLRENGRIDLARLEQLWSAVDERVFVLIDQAANHANDLERLIRSSRQSTAQVTVIVTASQAEWNAACERLEAFFDDESKHELPARISEAEVDVLLEKLERYDSLGVLTGRSQQERRAAFLQHAQRHVLVALYQATHGEPFEEIIVREYRGLQPAEAQRLYLGVALLHRFGVPVRAMLIHRAFGIGHQQFRDRFFKPLEQVVFEEKDHLGWRYRTRHPVIATILFERGMPNPEDRAREIARVMRCLNLSYESDAEAFAAMIHYRQLLEQFRGSPKSAKMLYAAALEIGAVRDVHWQHGMYEMRREGGSLDEASALFDLALLDSPGDPFVVHARSELELARAERATDAEQRRRFAREAQAQLAPLLHRPAHKQVALHTQGKIELLLLRHAIRDDDAGEIAEGTERLRSLLDRAQREYQDDPRFLKLDADLSRLLRDSERALEFLERAFEAGPEHPHIAVELEMAYRQAGREADSDRVLDQALDQLPDNRKLNWVKFKRLQTTAEPATLLGFLRKSFNDGDPVGEPQFWYARFAFEFGGSAEKERARRLFEKLKNRYGYGKDGAMVRDVAKEGGQSRTFTGLVTRKERDYAFVRRELDGESLYAARSSTSAAVWEDLNEARRVSFHIGYRYSGLTAQGLELL